MDEHKFWSKVNLLADDGCWLWTGTVTGKESHLYGSGCTLGKESLAHRVSWVLHFGTIPKDMVVCHKCDRTLCINPNHLFLGTPKDNVHDMVSKKRHAIGSQKSFSKLKESDIPEIRKLKSQGLYNYQIGEKFGVSASVICRLLNGKAWFHCQ